MGECVCMCVCVCVCVCVTLGFFTESPPVCLLLLDPFVLPAAGKALGAEMNGWGCRLGCRAQIQAWLYGLRLLPQPSRPHIAPYKRRVVTSRSRDCANQVGWRVCRGLNPVLAGSERVPTGWQVLILLLPIL